MNPNPIRITAAVLAAAAVALTAACTSSTSGSPTPSRTWCAPGGPTVDAVTAAQDAQWRRLVSADKAKRLPVEIAYAATVLRLPPSSLHQLRAEYAALPGSAAVKARAVQVAVTRARLAATVIGGTGC